MAITTRATLATALAHKQAVFTTKASFNASSSGRFISLFRVAGSPVGGSTPTTTGAALDSTTAGALTLPAPSGTTYLAGIGVSSTAPGLYLLYDRLIETGGLSGTSTSAQTVGSASLPTRNTSGAGTELWLEVYTAIGVTQVSATASYTNQSGTSGRTATLNGSTNVLSPANTTQPFYLQSGDTGVQSVQSVTLGASTGTIGSFGVTIRQPIAPVVMTLASWSTANDNPLGWAETGLTVIPDTACLELLMLMPNSTSGVTQAAVTVIQG